MIKFEKVGFDDPIKLTDGQKYIDGAIQDLYVDGLETVFLGKIRPVWTVGNDEERAGFLSQTRAGGAHYLGRGILAIAPVVRGGSGRVHKWLIDAAARTCLTFGIDVRDKPEYPGLWVEDRKIASIGLIQQDDIVAGLGGLSINVSGDPGVYVGINSCDIPGISMTSMALESGKEITIEEVADLMIGFLEEYPIR